ncbi:PREDICTED: caspase recruitment domain-containing protein 6-like [Myotis brandtii]|nr:PREDICTED: caspase recruitment domain-containing protein 6-like [Myotis brandtii]
MFRDKESSDGEMAWSSRENEKAYDPPTTTMPHSAENVESEVSGTTDYSQDQQRYDEPDDSLYLGEEEYLESAVFSEDAESTVEGEDHDDPEYLVYGGEEDPVYSETAEFSGDEESYGDSEPGMPLEEEEEESMEESLKHEHTESPQSTGVSKNSEDPFSPGKKQPESSEITVSFKEKEHLDVETSEMFRDKESSDGEMAWSSRENEKAYDPPTTTMPHSAENVESEVSGTTDYSQDQQRYDEPDDSLYLGEEEYLESAVFSEDAESTVEGEDHDDPEYLVYGGEEDPVYSETAEFSGDEESYGDSEPGMPLEEEEEESMEGMK